MGKFLKSRIVQSMLPYFVLAVGVILFFQLITGLNFFTNIISNFFSILSPFITGAIFAYILNMPTDFFQRLFIKTNKPFFVKRARGFGLIIVFIIVIAVFAGALNIIIPAIVSSITVFIIGFEENMARAIAIIDAWDLPYFIADMFEGDLGEGLIGMLQTWIANLDTEGILSSVIAGFGGAAAALFHFFISLVSCIYMLSEKDRFCEFITRLLNVFMSKEASEKIFRISRKLDKNFRQYIYVQTIDGLILGSVMTLVLALLIRSPFFLVLGLILAVLNYIPYFGSIIGTAIAVVVVAFTQGVWPTAVIAAIFMFAIQQLDGNWLQPKLMGGSFSIRPLLRIISVTVGGAYGGVFGMLIAIPIVAVLKDILDDYMEHNEKMKQMDAMTSGRDSE